MNESTNLIIANVERAIAQVASTQRKKEYRNRAHRFVKAQQLKPAAVSFSLDLWDRSRKNTNGGLPGFKGSTCRSPRYSYIQTPSTTAFTTAAAAKAIKKNYATRHSHHNPRKYIKSPRHRPHLIVKTYAGRHPAHPHPPQQQRPATCASTRSTLSPRATAAAAYCATASTRPHSAVTAIAPTSTGEAQYLVSPRIPTAPATAAVDDVPTREELFQQQFRKLRLQVYDHFVVQGIPQTHRPEMITTPRARSTPPYGMQGDFNGAPAPYLGSEQSELRVPTVEVKRRRIRSKSRYSGRNHRTKNKKKKTRSTFIRVTVKVPPGGLECSGNNNDGAKPTRLRTKNQQRKEHQRSLRVNSPEEHANVFEGEGWETTSY